MTAYAGSPTNWTTAGHQPTAAEANSWYLALQALTDPWTPFAAVWTATGTAPAIGNGTITTSYMQDGKLVHWRGSMSFGSTTTFGSGIYVLTLPVTAVDTRWAGSAMFTHTTATLRQVGVVFPNSTTQIVWYTTGAGQVTNTAPFTWASGMSLSWSCTYEAA